MNSSGSKNRISRREFLKGIRSKSGGIPIIDKEKCTGCGLCTVDCLTEALSVLQTGKEDIYQILFRNDLCNACGNCVKSCPEKCLQLEWGLKLDRTSKGPKAIFEDRISRCHDCGISLFPLAMVNHLKSKILMTGGASFPFDLCPSCRIKIQVGRESVTKK